MPTVSSLDGTTIAFDSSGSGPAVVLVGGALDDGAETAPLAAELSGSVTVCNYARRGRGGSGDTPPYAIEREIEDLAALISAAGGSAHVLGVSSGGALALEAEAAGLPIERLAVYEVPYNLVDDGPHWHAGDGATAAALAAEGRHGEVVELFMRTVGTPEEWIDAARSSPAWPALEALAPTLVYDAACVRDGRPPVDRLARVTLPTLVLTGGGSHGSLPADFFHDAADAIAFALPHAERRILADQGHVADPVVLAPVLTSFFLRGSTA